MTADEVRAGILRKAEKHRRGRNIPQETWTKIWLEMLEEADWGFMDVMRFVAFHKYSILDYSSTHPQIVVVHLSLLLSTENMLWKRWFFKDFPDFVRDLKLDFDDRHQIPYPWMKDSFEHAHANPHPDDYLFRDVPWRSYYMWTYFFRRQCAKGVIAHIAYTNLREGILDETWRDDDLLENADIFERNGQTHMTAAVSEYSSDSDSGPGEETTYQVDFLDIIERHMAEEDLASMATPYLIWHVYMWNRYHLNEREGQVDAALARSPTDVGTILNQVIDDYNFTRDVIESFIRWYVMQIPKPDRINLLEFEPLACDYYVTDGGRLSPISMEWSAEMLGLYNAKTNRWLLLEKLALCPRRKDRKTGRDIQFLGWKLN